MPKVVDHAQRRRELVAATWAVVAAEGIEAATVRRLIAELDARYPGFGEYIDKRMAISIDGEIHQDAGQVPLTPRSEVYLFPRIGGG